MEEVEIDTKEHIEKARRAEMYANMVEDNKALIEENTKLTEEIKKQNKTYKKEIEKIKKQAEDNNAILQEILKKVGEK